LASPEIMKSEIFRFGKPNPAKPELKIEN